MLDGIFEGGDQSLIFGEVVGLVTEIFAERGDLASGFVLDHYAVAGGAGIAAGAAITVSDQIMRGRILAGFEERLGSSAAGVVHDSSLQRREKMGFEHGGVFLSVKCAWGPIPFKRSLFQPLAASHSPVGWECSIFPSRGRPTIPR
jgi:hypothetical protein